MKKLTADEFAAKVMSTGTELEVDELRTQSLRTSTPTSTCTMGMSRLKISAHPITC